MDVTVVGVVSDTHFPRFGRALPRALERGLRRAGVTRILHLGDLTDLLAVELFETIAPFDAVGVLRSTAFSQLPDPPWRQPVLPAHPARSA